MFPFLPIVPFWFSSLLYQHTMVEGATRVGISMAKFMKAFVDNAPLDVHLFPGWYQPRKERRDIARRSYGI